MKYQSFFPIILILLLTLSLHGKEKKKQVKYSIDIKNEARLHREGELKGADGIQVVEADRDYLSLLNSSRLSAKYDNWFAGIRKDLFFIFEKDIEDSLEYAYSNDHFNHGAKHYLERIYLGRRIRAGKMRLSLTVGDFYENINRGLMLSMTKSPIYGDNSIRGFSSRASYKPVSAKLFGGYANPTLRDPLLEKRLQDSWDWLFGGEVTWDITPKIKIGADYTGAFYDEDYSIVKRSYEVSELEKSIEYDKQTLEKHFHMVGGFIQLNNPFPKFSSYAGFSILADGSSKRNEFSIKPLPEEPYYQLSDPKERFNKDIGNANALYISMKKWFDFNKNRLTISAEGKRYERYYVNYDTVEDIDLQRRYFNPPRLIDNEFEIENEFDTWGVRGKVSFADNHLTGTTYHLEFVTGAPLDNDEYFNSNKATYRWEKYYYGGGGFKKSFPHLNIEGKVAYFKSENNPESEDKGESGDLREWYYGKLNLGGHIHKLSLKSQNRIFVKNEDNYRENAIDLNNILDITWDNTYTLSLMSTYWNGSLVEGKDEFFPAAQVSYRHRYVKASVFYGQMKGGKVCAGGVCRNLPDFEGLKFQLDFKF